MEQTRQLLNQCSRIKQHYEKIERLSGDNFNIFQIINLTTKEVRLHSSFLAELLNPQGSHGQGDIYLKAFTDKLGIENFDCSQAIVTKEKYIGEISGSRDNAQGGYIDIFIDDKNGNSITIENKIYAGDQEDQLRRYYNHSPKNIFYLTLDGKDAGECSRSGMTEGTDYRLISYKNEILDWLETCQKESYKYPVIREGIYHYISLIQNLTNQTRNKEMREELIALMTETPSSLASTYTLVNEFHRAKAKIQKKFWNSLIDAIEKRGFTIKNKSEFKEKIGDLAWAFYNETKNNKNYGLWVEIYNQDGVTIHWKCEVGSYIYYGYTLEKDGKGGICNNPENKKYIDLIHDCDQTYSTDNDWLGWKYHSPELNFTQFKTQVIFDLADEANRTKVAEAIATKMVEDITFIQDRIDKIK